MRPAHLRTVAALALLALAGRPALSEENLYQKRDRLKADLARLQAERRAVGQEARDRLVARLELTQARLRIEQKYFVHVLSMGAHVTVDYIIPSTETLARAILEQLLRENYEQRFANEQQARLALLAHLNQRIDELEAEQQGSLADLGRLFARIDAVQHEIARIDGIVAAGPSGGRPPADQPAESPEALIPLLTRYFAEESKGQWGNLELEYTRPWAFNVKLGRFECNYRIWKTRPGPGENPSGFKRHVAASNENPLRPMWVSLSDARKIARAGKWLR